MLHGRPHLCFWRFFCPAGCYKYSARCLLLILPVTHKRTPSHSCKNAVGWCFSGHRLVWHSRTSKQKQRRKDLPLGGAVAIHDFKSLPSTRDWEPARSYHSCKPGSARKPEAACCNTPNWLNKHREVILRSTKQKSDFCTLKQSIICVLL